MTVLFLFTLVLLLAAIMPATLQSKETQSLEKISEGSSKFAMDFFQALKGEEGNLICSPINAEIPLAMAYHGAVGVTADEMAKVLHLPSQKEEILLGHSTLIKSLNEIPELKMASKIFIDNSFSLIPEYKTVTTNYYLSEVKKEDFMTDSAGAVKDINNWVENNTNHRIKDLLSSDAVTPETRMVLVSAIYFKAKWLNPFDPQHTKIAPFYITPEETVDVQMMHLRDTKFKYTMSSELNAQIIEMPYSGNCSMVIINPVEKDGLKGVEEKLATVNMSDVMLELKYQSLNIQLPKFKIEKTMNLNNVLMKMGMINAFSNGANFSGIANEALKISDVIQKAFVEVNEEGTEAAAATGITIVLTSAFTPHTIIDFICDRPFLFFITNKERNNILFISRINNFIK